MRRPGQCRSASFCEGPPKFETPPPSPSPRWRGQTPAAAGWHATARFNEAEHCSAPWREGEENRRRRSLWSWENVVARPSATPFIPGFMWSADQADAELIERGRIQTPQVIHDGPLRPNWLLRSLRRSAAAFIERRLACNSGGRAAQRVSSSSSARWGARIFSAAWRASSGAFSQ